MHSIRSRHMRTARVAACAAVLAVALAVLPGPRPAAAQTATLEPVARLDVPAALVELAGGYAYVAGGETFRIVDVSNPARAAPRGALTAPGPLWAVTYAPPPH